MTVRVALADIDRVAANRPAGYREKVIAAGRVVGPHVILDLESYLKLRAEFHHINRTAFGARLRTEAEQAACLAVCRACQHLTDDQRCAACNRCGGRRLVSDLVRLSLNRCPKNLWPQISPE